MSLGIFDLQPPWLDELVEWLTMGALLWLPIWVAVARVRQLQDECAIRIKLGRGRCRHGGRIRRDDEGGYGSDECADVGAR